MNIAIVHDVILPVVKYGGTERVIWALGKQLVRFGAPVFATPMGAIPEIITPEFGFLSSDEQEIANYLNTKPQYSPQHCHQYAADIFNVRIMAENYLKVFERVLNGETLSPQQSKFTT